MQKPNPKQSEPVLGRRRFLAATGGGFGALALAHMLGSESFAEDRARGPRPNWPRGGMHHPAKATRVVQLFMSGAASQCDTFDYKPLLVARNGEKFDPGGKVELFQSQPGDVMASPWRFRQHGGCGRYVSDLLPHLAQRVDDIAFLPAMVSKSNVHGPATFMQNTGFVLPGFPSMGAWVSYGLGGMSESLPTFVVLPDARGFPPNGPANWGAGFLPAAHQGTMVRPSARNPIHDLFPVPEAGLDPAAQSEGLLLLNQLNHDYASTRPDDSRLSARVASYELAARLQLSAPEVLDIASESHAVRALYGLDEPITADFGRNCLIARRLLERGVRFVQVWSGADNGFPRRNWDSHEDLARDHLDMGTSMDRPTAALLIDLKARGLLDETIVIWTTEFGRMPCSQGSKGRDHNPFAFTSWLAGGGIKGGVMHGKSDEWSFRTAENETTCYDLHATVLHLLGVDHTRLTYKHNGIDRRLTDVHGRVISEILA